MTKLPKPPLRCPFVEEEAEEGEEATAAARSQQHASLGHPSPRGESAFSPSNAPALSRIHSHAPLAPKTDVSARAPATAPFFSSFELLPEPAHETIGEIVRMKDLAHSSACSRWLFGTYAAEQCALRVGAINVSSDKKPPGEFHHLIPLLTRRTGLIRLTARNFRAAKEMIPTLAIGASPNHLSISCFNSSDVRSLGLGLSMRVEAGCGDLATLTLVEIEGGCGW